MLTIIYPETPIFLLKAGKHEVSMYTLLNYQHWNNLLKAAESSLRFYRNVQVTGKETPLQFREEFENLKTQLGTETGRQMEKTPLLLTDFSELAIAIKSEK